MKKWSFVALSILFSTNLFAAINNESEIGVLISKGNSDSQSLSAKETVAQTWDEVNSLKLNARFFQTKTSGVENARYWSSGLRFDRSLSHRFGFYLGQIVESDKYSGFNQRYNSDIGAKYWLIKEDKFQWDAELGYRYTIENQLSGLQNKYSSIRTYTEANKIWSEGVSTKLWLEYLPNLTTSSDYQMNSELSVTAALNNIFSVKSGYLLRYDNLLNPGAHTKTDSLFTTALVAKF